MAIRVRVIGATFLVAGLMLDASCSSSSKSDDQSTPAGSGGSSGDSDSAGKGGSTSHAGTAGKSGHAGNAAAGDAGSGEGGTDSAGAAGSSGAGGEAGAADPCAACPSGACLPTTGECVDCVASNDRCPDGQYCTAQNTCASGCKNAASCASGVCTASHDCQSCIADTECSTPHVCGASQCAVACTADQEGTSMGCSTGLTCCSTHCVDATTDSQHCGACGTACSAGQFCGVGGCHDSALSGLCSIAKVTIVLDGQDGNAVPARAIAAGLAAQCAPAPVVREVSQDVADAVNTSSGRPVAGGDELLIATGGFFFAHLTNYVTSQPVAPIYGVLSTDGLSQEYRKRSNDAVVATEPNDGSHDSDDYVLIQIMRDASSGSVILNAQGFWQSGTTAAAYYIVNAMLPALSTETKSWYVYKWTDANADKAPDLNEFVLVDSGT